MTPEDGATATPRIVTDYRTYQPPVDAEAIVRVLLRYVPPDALAGLGEIRLTSRPARPSRKGRGDATPARYHRTGGGQPARVELFVDQALAAVPPAFLGLRVLREWALADALYPELGHHPDAPPRASRRYLRRWFTRRYWYLYPLLLAYRATAGLRGRRGGRRG
jgi:hypothetical protein